MCKKLLKRIRRHLTIEKKVPVTVPVQTGRLLEGHCAFIAGGSGGIGSQIAKQFVENGCTVVISGTNESKLKSICQECGEQCTYLVVDLSNIASMKEAIARFLQTAENRIDILVNAAGVHGPADFWTVTESDYDEVMNINLKAAFFLSQQFAAYMRDNQIKGHILNISSASALKPGKTPYEISKNAMRAFTLGLADVCIPYGIVVNCLAPGPTATKMLNKDENSSLNWSGNPSGRIATPQEIANWAVMLASSFGDYIVGDSLYVTGGSGTICIDK